MPSSAASLMQGCSFCNSPAGKQALFFGAMVLLAVSWHAHIWSMME